MEEVDGASEIAMLNRLLVLEREKRIRAERLVEAERQLLLQLKMSTTCSEVEEGGADLILPNPSRSSSCASLRFPRNFSQDFTSSVMNQLSGELREVLGSGKRCRPREYPGKRARLRLLTVMWFHGLQTCTFMDLYSFLLVMRTRRMHT